MPDRFEKKYHHRETEIVEIPEGERLYLVVPTDWRTNVVSFPVLDRVKRALVRDMLEGRIDHPTFAAFRDLFSNPRLYTVWSAQDTRPIWSIAE